MKYTIKEVPGDSTDLSFFFDGDGLTEKSGDYNYNLFVVYTERYNIFSGFNIDEYKHIVNTIENLFNDFSDVENGWKDYDGKKLTYKQAIIDNGLQYNAVKCSKLKALYKRTNTIEPYAVANYLTIITGEKWSAVNAYGYCQGDVVTVIFCEKYYAIQFARAAGEIWLGAAKEFSVTETDENGTEIETVYGYIVADSQAITNKDYKKIVCEQAGINENETSLQIITGQHTQTIYTYETV